MTPRTDAAALAAVEVATRELHLPTIRADAEEFAGVATRERLTHLGFLAEVLAAEVDARAERRRVRRVREARFPRVKRLEAFDVSASALDAPQVALLADGSFIDEGTPLVMIGDSGTGKTHLLIGTGIAACETGRSVRYVTAAALVNELVEAADERVLSRLVGRYGRVDLLLIDELGYLSLDPRGAELLFQVITEREEKASIATGTNLPFSEWGQMFPDPRLAAAVVDRLTYKAHILETGTESYRLRSSRSKKRKGGDAPPS